jgi:uncharacterized protein (DUF1810 family)
MSQCGSASRDGETTHSKMRSPELNHLNDGSDLIRFLDAQDQIFGQVVDELTHGPKQTHWMWFIFPQLVGLVRSAMAQHYSIKNLDQARRYLADTTLGVRLREAVRLMVEHRGKPVFEILGSPDDLEFRSCVTLFREAASEPRTLAPLR